MNHLRLCAKLGALTLIIAAAWVALLHPYKATANDANTGVFDGGSYLVTSTDSKGNFAARNVFTLHADHTMSVVDSNSGGPTAHFTSEWARGDPTARVGRLEGRLISICIRTGMSHALITRLASKITAAESSEPPPLSFFRFREIRSMAGEPILAPLTSRAS
jgi:hypothetical protein